MVNKKKDNVMFSSPVKTFCTEREGNNSRNQGNNEKKYMFSGPGKTFCTDHVRKYGKCGKGNRLLFRA